MSVSSSKARIHICLVASMVIAGLFALALAAALILDLLDITDRSEWRAVGLVRELQNPQPQLRSIENREFYLVWADAGLIALSTTDPHKGICSIRWFEHEHFFADPCGGSVYLPNGSYWRGPSPRSMDRFTLRVVDGQVQVNIQHITLGQRHV